MTRPQAHALLLYLRACGETMTGLEDEHRDRLRRDLTPDQNAAAQAAIYDLIEYASHRVH